MSNPVIENPKVLVIEDNPIERKVLETILFRHRCKVHSVAFTREILSIISTEKLDVVILSVEAGKEKTGIKILRNIRKLSPTVPVVVVCELHFSKIIQEYKTYGANQLISRPFSADPIIKAVERYSNPNHSNKDAVPG